jgi:hypothetical protein
MKKPHSSVVRRGTFLKGLASRLSLRCHHPWFITTKMRINFSRFRMGKKRVSPMRAKATRMRKVCLTSCRGWKAPMQVS